MKALEIKNLEKIYWNTKVLKWIDLDIQEGDFFWLLWHNWAWKTTIIGILTGLVEKNGWNISVFWCDIEKDKKQAKSFLWVVPQEFNFNIFTKVKDVPVIQAGFYWIDKNTAQKRTKDYLKKLGLWEKRNAEVRELSWWMKRRLMIVRALVHNPKLLILDEPTEWIDVELRKQMWEFIRELNSSWTTILLTSHYLEEVEALCNKVAIMSEWKIIENTYISDILKKLDREVIVLNTKNEIKNISSDFKKKYYGKILSLNEIEICLWKKNTFNELFEDISKEGIVVSSLRNKTSRLEQLFLDLTKK